MKSAYYRSQISAARGHFIAFKLLCRVFLAEARRYSRLFALISMFLTTQVGPTRDPLAACIAYILLSITRLPPTRGLGSWKSNVIARKPYWTRKSLICKSFIFYMQLNVNDYTVWMTEEKTQLPCIQTMCYWFVEPSWRSVGILQKLDCFRCQWRWREPPASFFFGVYSWLVMTFNYLILWVRVMGQG